jgi:NAD(P)H dehydrogenase (quinone)
MILVTGAGGKTGRAVITALAAAGRSVRAFAHRDAHTAAVRACGAVAVSVGSLDDVDAIAHAAKGVQAVYHICPNVSAFELAFAQAVVTGIKRAGVRRFVYHSVLHPQIEAMPHHWQKMRVEDMLFASGLDVTILQPTAYMQNVFMAWPTIVASGMIRIPYSPDARISLVDLDDVAAAAAIATGDEHIGATYELVGTVALSQREVAGIISSVLGKLVRVEQEPAKTWSDRARNAGLGDYQRETLLKMFDYYGRHGLVGSPNTLEWLLGREPTTLAAVIARHRNDS